MFTLAGGQTIPVLPPLPALYTSFIFPSVLLFFNSFIILVEPVSEEKCGTITFNFRSPIFFNILE